VGVLLVVPFVSMGVGVGVGRLGSGCSTVASGDDPVMAKSGDIGCTFAVSHVFCRQPIPNEFWIVCSSEKWL
jgi:hypothetical protein